MFLCRGGIFHNKRFNTILSPVFAMQLSRDIGLGLVGSLGFGIGWISAFFQPSGKVVFSQVELMRVSRAECPVSPMFLSIEYVTLSAPGAVSLPGLKACESSERVNGVSVMSGIEHAVSITCILFGCSLFRLSMTCCGKFAVADRDANMSASLFASLRGL